MEFDIFAERKDLLLENLVNEVAPIIEPLTEKYFGQEFIKNNLEKYKISSDFIWTAGLYISKEEWGSETEPKKRFIGLGFGYKFKENYDKNLISGNGIFNILHELTHLYQVFKQPEIFKALRFREAHAEISAYEILVNSNEPKLNFAKDYAIKNNLKILNEPKKEIYNMYKLLSFEKDIKKRETELFQKCINQI